MAQPATSEDLSSAGPVALVRLAYLPWNSLVVSKVNAEGPCGLRTDVCGYPYPFLNDFTPLPRGLSTSQPALEGVLLKGIILKLWRSSAPPNT